MTDTKVIVTIENLAPEGGTFITPVWVGFHNGKFDTFDRGTPVSPGLESLAEDGDFALLSQEFVFSGYGSVNGAVFGTEGLAEGPIDPGEIATATFVVDSDDPNSQFLNYAAMVIPSNDAFIANGNRREVQIFDEDGNFIGADFIVSGGQVLDAGTEINDEAEESTAFFGQTAPNTGTDQNGVVRRHRGFIENGRILSEDGSSPSAITSFTNADFTESEYQVARITISTEEDNTSPPSELVEVTVTVENLAPENGTFLTPLWAAFHDGTFDTYNRGNAVSPGLESLAEDGDASVLSSEFISSGAGLVDGVILGTEGAEGPIDPGETTSFTFTLDSSLDTSRFFSYASMVIPSNDAFIANGNPEAIEIFDEDGNFIGADFVVSGRQVLDAGTEVNDEAETSTAFFGQAAPNTGVEQSGVVRRHRGFIEDGRILSESQFAGSDFTTEDYQVARITISTEVVEPEPLEVIIQDSEQGTELVDLRGFDNQQIEINPLEVSSDAGFKNQVGFYAIEDVNGTVLDEFGNALIPGDQGYAQAAIARSVMELDQNSSDTVQVTGGNLLAPYIIANGTVEEFLSSNPDTTSRRGIQAYFSFLGANTDGVEHIRLQNDNTFVFEDLLGGGDNDFNDFSFRAEFDVV